MAAGSIALPVGLLGLQRNTSFVLASQAASTPAASSAKPRSRSSGTSRTAAPWMRAATAYMPKVGGQMTTLSTPARQKPRTSRSMDSSLPRPGSSCCSGTP